VNREPHNVNQTYRRPSGGDIFWDIPMTNDQKSDQLNQSEEKRLMDDALKRALSTPPQPHKPKADDSKAVSKPRRKKVRA
jgi:hypothetical protein